MKSEGDCLTFLVTAAMLPVAWLVSMSLLLLRAVIIQSGWTWFIEPVTGSSTPSVVVFFAVLLMWYVATSKTQVKRDRSFKDSVVDLASLTVTHLMAWGTLYLVHLWCGQ